MFGKASTFDPSSLGLDIWFEMDNTGGLRGSVSGTYSGDLSDETAIAAALSGDEFCSSWDDLGSAGLDLAQATTSLQPSWLTAAEGGLSLPALSFSADRLTNAAGFDFSSTYECSLLALFKTGPAVTSTYRVFTSRHANSEVTLTISGSNLRGTVLDNTSSAKTGAARSGAVSTDTLYLAQYFYDGSSSGELYLNGVLQGGTSGVSNMDVGTAVGAAMSGSHAFNGEIWGVMFKAGDFSPSRSSLDAYFQTKYGFSF